jgi:hypothetical protein
MVTPDLYYWDHIRCNNRVGLYCLYRGVSWNHYFETLHPLSTKNPLTLKPKEYQAFEARAVSITAQLLQAVILLHKIDIVHNDIWYVAFHNS